ncbi:hypothetical protein ACFPC0_23405 [Streptomyces andamanensis]|uniref:Uncharacterized protein n=1 Tax=Streptomyces andamanensis TaxID=1565035 RepID=A0ABV8TJQ8_9ACTN
MLAGDSDGGFALLRAVADLRPHFASAAQFTGELGPQRLAEGPARPRLVCLSTPMATGGQHQHARLASHFRGVRPVSTLPTPGFTPGRQPARLGGRAHRDPRGRRAERRRGTSRTCCSATPPVV